MLFRIYNIYLKNKNGKILDEKTIDNNIEKIKKIFEKLLNFSDKKLYPFL